MMQTKNSKKWLSFILCMVLAAAMALVAAGCGSKNDGASSDAGNAGSQSEGGVMGEGATVFDFTVVDQDGKETKFEIHTDKEKVGEALEELGLIAGEEGDYGLYVKTVNGITLDYDTDGKYWAFYVNDEYGLEGVDLTAIEDGASYAFKAE